MDHSDTKSVYDEAYRKDTVNYGCVDHDVDSRYSYQLEVLRGHMAPLGLGPRASVLEVGCGLGRLRECHPNWQGIEYSSTAVAHARELFGEGLAIREGDATRLPVESDSVDLYFSFATLEHVPAIDAAFAEIERVVRPGGHAVVGPAWNCRPWTVKKLQQRPYSELGLKDKVGKLLIPIRNNLLFRLACSVPARLRREASLALGRRSLALEFDRLHPDLSLWERYPHIADDDAFVSIDAHAALAYFHSRGWKLVSHPGFLRRFGCRGEAVVVRKPDAR